MMWMSDFVWDLITFRSIVGAMVRPLGQSLHTTSPSSICGISEFSGIWAGTWDCTGCGSKVGILGSK